MPVLKYILTKSKSEVNVGDEDNNTPLGCASEHGHVAGVEYLLSKRADHRIANTNGMQPMHLASQQGHVLVIDALIKGRASVMDAAPKKGMGSMPLHFAAGMGALSTAKLLIEKGAEVNAHASGQMTPLHVAAIMGSGNFMPKFLVQSGAEVNAFNVQGMRPMDMAKKGGHQPTIARFEALMEEEEDKDIEEEEKVKEKQRKSRKPVRKTEL